MYEIKFLAKYKRKYKRLKLSLSVKEKLENAIDVLIATGSLDGMYRDHKIHKSKATKRTGNQNNNREFHLDGNLIVRYIVDESHKIILFCDIGTHRRVLLTESYDLNSPTRTKLFG